MKSRVLLLILCTCIMLGTVHIPLTAAAPNIASGIQPFWVNVANVSLSMSYSSGKINWVGQIKGLSGTNSIVASYTLEKKGSNGGYTFVDSWQNLKSSSSILISNGSTSGTAGTYKLTVSITVTRNGVTETVTDSLEKSLP